MTPGSLRWDFVSIIQVVPKKGCVAKTFSFLPNLPHPNILKAPLTDQTIKSAFRNPAALMFICRAPRAQADAIWQSSNIWYVHPSGRSPDQLWWCHSMSWCCMVRSPLPTHIISFTVDRSSPGRNVNVRVDPRCVPPNFWDIHQVRYLHVILWSILVPIQLSPSGLIDNCHDWAWMCLYAWKGNDGSLRAKFEWAPRLLARVWPSDKKRSLHSSIKRQRNAT